MRVHVYKEDNGVRRALIVASKRAKVAPQGISTGSKLAFREALAKAVAEVAEAEKVPYQAIPF